MNRNHAEKITLIARGGGGMLTGVSGEDRLGRFYFHVDWRSVRHGFGDRPSEPEA